MRRIEKAIVTGPTGAIGIALSKLIADQGIRVYAIVRPGSDRAKRLKKINGIIIIECDISNLKSLLTLIPERNIDAFFHLA